MFASLRKLFAGAESPAPKRKTTLSLTAFETRDQPAALSAGSLFSNRAIIIVGGRGSQVSLNPQPIPPKDTAVKILNPVVKVGLNPQPLPPRIFRF